MRIRTRPRTAVAFRARCTIGSGEPGHRPKRSSLPASRPQLSERTCADSRSRQSTRIEAALRSRFAVPAPRNAGDADARRLAAPLRPAAGIHGGFPRRRQAAPGKPHSPRPGFPAPAPEPSPGDREPGLGRGPRGRSRCPCRARAAPAPRHAGAARGVRGAPAFGAARPEPAALAGLRHRRSRKRPAGVLHEDPPRGAGRRGGGRACRCNA